MSTEDTPHGKFWACNVFEEEEERKELILYLEPYSNPAINVAITLTNEQMQIVQDWYKQVKSAT